MATPQPGLTPDALRRLADQHEAQAKELRAIADQMAADLARALKRAEAELAKQSRLPSTAQRSIVVDNMESLSTAIRDRMGRPLKTDHPFPRALEAAGSNIDEWAAKHFETEDGARRPLKSKTVRAWYQTAGKRRIPRKWAAVIERELGLPATIETWPNGIRD